MDWGMRNRMARIIQPDTGHTVMLAVDHGYFLGPTRCIEDAQKCISPLLGLADVLMPTRGVLRNCVDASTHTTIVLRVSGGTSIVGEALSNEGIFTAFEDAIRLNVAGVSLSIFVGTPHERQTLLGLSELVNQGERYGMPVIAVTAVGKELGKRDARFLALSSRIAAELGCQIVKTYYCEEFEKVVEGCPVPIVIAGGPKLDTELDVFKMVADAIAKGAVGVDMGRNIWQNPHPVAMIKAVRAVVHEKASPEAALELYNSEKG